jgi:hypothetical protein
VESGMLIIYFVFRVVARRTRNTNSGTDLGRSKARHRCVLVPHVCRLFMNTQAPECEYRTVQLLRLMKSTYPRYEHTDYVDRAYPSITLMHKLMLSSEGGVRACVHACTRMELFGSAAHASMAGH